MKKKITTFIKECFGNKEFIPLHEPYFSKKENQYVSDAISSTFVSSVGKYVDKFEKDIAIYTNSESAVATMNGTSAIHTALVLAGVKYNTYVLTQSLTFIATCNAIKYCGANPIFIDVDIDTLGLSPNSLELWLEKNAYINNDGSCLTKFDHKEISACLPMHTFGHPVKIDEILIICAKWNIPLVEDAAESFGSFFKDQHTGTFGLLGAVSFNGNKTLTTGGGGIILSKKDIGLKAKHITTTAKEPHPYEFIHNDIGFNYRMPNLNAAFGCAQLESLDYILNRKRKLAMEYEQFFLNTEYKFVSEPKNCKSNYWLNAIICRSFDEKQSLIEFTNSQNVNTRPVWTLMNKLPMFKDCKSDDLTNSIWLSERIVNLPSSVI